jgi:hypothetical protein
VQGIRQTSPACAASFPPCSKSFSCLEYFSTTGPPPALGTPRGRARGCHCRPATLCPRDGRLCSSFCVCAVLARAVGMCSARDACCATEPRCSFPHDICRRTAPCRVRSPPHLLLSSPAAAECLRALCSTMKALLGTMLG